MAGIIARASSLVAVSACTALHCVCSTQAGLTPVCRPHCDEGGGACSLILVVTSHAVHALVRHCVGRDNMLHECRRRSELANMGERSVGAAD